MSKKIFGSFLSILCGWSCGWACLVVIYFFGNRQYDYNHISDAIWSDLGVFLLMGIFILPSWLLAFMPLYVFMPRKSFMWRWYVCTPLGGLAGAIILLSPVAYSELIIYHAKISDILSTWPLSLPAAVVGSVTCLVGTLTFDRFNPESS
jgi:hypothetical protein